MRYKQLRFSAWSIAIALIVLALTAYGQAQPAATTPPAAAAPASATPAANPQNPPSDITAKDMEMAKIVEEAYQKQVSTQEKTMYWILGVVIIVAGYVVIRKEKEYRQALTEAKEAAKDAHAACKEARSWDSKMADLYREQRQYVDDFRKELDAKADAKLAEIQSKGEELITKLSKQAKDEREASEQQAEKERKISELWANGSRAYTEGDFEESIKARQDIAELAPEDAENLTNWGTALSAQAKKKEDAAADTLFQQAYDKFAQAVKIKPDMHRAWHNWGTALMNQAKKKAEPERENLFQQAEAKLLQARKIGNMKGAYNLACIAALRGDEQKCREWLLIGEAAKTLPTREHVLKDDDLASVRDKDWFKAIRWKGE